MKDFNYSPLFEEANKIVRTFGAEILEIGDYFSKNNVRINIFLYHKNGVDFDLCQKINSVLLPRLEIFYASKEVYLELSSPGLNRKIKTSRELEIFLDADIKIMFEEENEYLEGIIYKNSSGEFFFRKKDSLEEIKIDLKKVKKAQLIDKLDNLEEELDN